MNGEQSRLLATGNRVCWNDDQADQGTIAKTDWSGVEIVWDNGAQIRTMWTGADYWMCELINALVSGPRKPVAGRLLAF